MREAHEQLIRRGNQVQATTSSFPRFHAPDAAMLREQSVMAI